MTFPSAFVRESDIKPTLDDIRAQLGTGIASLDYRLQDDWSGDPGIFFRVVITHEAARPEVLRKATRGVRDLADQKLDPFGAWKIVPYYYFRSESENNHLNNGGWG